MTDRNRKNRAWLTKKPRIIDFACEADLELKAAAGDDDGDPTFEMTAYNGGKMRPNGFPEDVVVELKSASITRETIPILRNHSSDRIVGHGTATVSKAGNKITASGVISGSGSDAQEVISSSRKGFPWQASIGARSELTFVDKGESVEVNGQSFDGPVYVGRNTRIHEISFVAVGGDQTTEVDVAAALETEEFDMPDSTQQTAAELELKAQLDQQKADAEASRKQLDELKASLAAEKRATAIRAAAQEFEATDEDLEAALGDDKISAEQAEISFARAAHRRLVESRPTPGGPAIHSTDSKLESQALTAAVCRHINVPEKGKTESGTAYGLEASFDEKALEASWEPKYRDVCLHSLMDMTIQMAGKSYSGNRKTREFVRTFLHADRDLNAAAGGFSTMAASNILADAANKALLAAYDAQEVVWPFICAVKSLSDFKTHNLYRLTPTGGYGEVGPDGELKHGTFSDQTYTLKGETYGMMLALNRENMINDDLNAFAAIPTALGTLAAQALEFAVIELLLANAGSFFSAGNGNNSTGAGSDLTIAGLDAAQQKFVNQVHDGKPIGLRPDRILVGAQDGVQAAQLYNDTEVRRQPGGTGTSRESIRNPFARQFTPYMTPLLNNTAALKMDGSAFSNQNGNKWYMFGNPNAPQGGAINVGFLNGNRTPVIESAEADFSTLGMQWRSYHDWGAAQGDPKLAVLSDGA